MTAPAPKHALRFMAGIAQEAQKLGLRKGLGAAAAKSNPVVMVLEAASAIVGVVDSFLQYRTAAAHRDGLRDMIPSEAGRLAAERAQLALQIERVRADMDQREQVRDRLVQLVKACVGAVRMAWDELSRLRDDDLPDLNRIDAMTADLDDAWRQFQTALEHHHQTSH